MIYISISVFIQVVFLFTELRRDASRNFGPRNALAGLYSRPNPGNHLVLVFRSDDGPKNACREISFTCKFIAPPSVRPSLRPSVRLSSPVKHPHLTKSSLLFSGSGCYYLCWLLENSSFLHDGDSWDGRQSVIY